MSSASEICVLCCREISLYAVGPCDHHVCSECSTRMRVLCEQSECPICRSDMPYVVFTKEKKSFHPPERYKLYNKQYTIAFENKTIQDSFHQLLVHKCHICKDMFDTFNDLKHHMRFDHVLFYCELCIKNLKIFPFERKCYTRKDLAYHNRKGDLDNTSHRGHPLCEYCDERFVDNDELYRHLRREHYFCHFCDADGLQGHQFYGEYSYLKVHFRKCHYLCEEGDCAKEQFIGAFRMEIDYKCHVALKHSKNKSKAEILQARTLGLEFNITPRNVHNGSASPNHSRQNYQRKDNDSRLFEDRTQESKQMQKQAFNTDCVQDFPSLNNDIATSTQKQLTGRFHSADGISSTAMTKRVIPIKPPTPIEHFPALSASNNRKTVNQLNSSTKVEANVKTNNNQKWSKAQGNAAKKSAQGGSMWMANKGPRNIEEEFPKLEIKPNKQFLQESRPSSLQQNTETFTNEIKQQDIAQDLYQKIKSKIKNRNGSTQPTLVETVIPQNNNSQLPQLSKIYAGIGTRTKDRNEFINYTSYSTNKKNRLHRNDDDDIPWHEEVTLIEDDFPPLGPSPAVAKCPPPGFGLSTNTSVAPPGFLEKSQSQNPLISLSSIAQQLSSKNENIKMNSTTLHSYEQPLDFDERNTSLITQIFEFVDCNNTLFDEFKCLSGSFRKDKIPALEYHGSCVRLLGKEKFSQLFPELLCLLPDIQKQQQLLNVHNIYLSKENKKKGALPKKTGVLFSSLITICSQCQQVLMKNDSNNHMESHKNGG